MNLRTDKYYEDDHNFVGSRTKRNEELYKDINKTELDNFEVKSNATVIGNNKGNNIDVEKIKSILDTHYNDAPRRRTIKLETPEPTPRPKPLTETKEYDINVILDKAKGEKIEDYHEDRNKKIRDTQFDILNNLDINPDDYVEDYEKENKPLEHERHSGASDDLQRLIDTIALNEEDIKKEKIKVEQTVTIKSNDDTDNLNKEIAKINDEFAMDDKTDSDPLDIFSDLKGDENTTVLEGLQEKTQNMIDDMQDTIATPKPKENAIDDSFYTKSTDFKKKDFEEYEEFEDVDKPTSPIVKIIIIILIIIFLVGIGILVKSFL